MKKISELKKILYDYVKEYITWQSTYENYESNVALFEQILKYLDEFMFNSFDNILEFNICLETLCGSQYSSLTQYIYEKKIKYLLNIHDEQLDNKINDIIEKIKIEYETAKLEKEKIKFNIDLYVDRIKSIRRVLSSLKFSQYISKDEINVVGDVLRELGYNDIDVSMSIEWLFIHNNDIISKQKRYIYQDKYKFINLLSLGYETFDYPDVTDSKKLSEMSKLAFDILRNAGDSIDESDYIKMIPVVGETISTIDELEFVLIKLLEYIRDEINSLIELLKDKDFIMHLETKNEVARDCYLLLNQYNYYRDYMDKEIAKYSSKEEEVVGQEEEKVLENNLFYLVNDSGKCFFLSDLKKFSYEYLDKVHELISGFKHNSISRKKTKRMIENDNAKGFLELKSDQIRIIYKKIKDNDYLIYGVFVKKDDRKYRAQFDNIVHRIGNISDSSALIEEEIFNYISNNSRKWSR